MNEYILTRVCCCYIEKEGKNVGEENEQKISLTMDLQKSEKNDDSRPKRGTTSSTYTTFKVLDHISNL